MKKYVLTLHSCLIGTALLAQQINATLSEPMIAGNISRIPCENGYLSMDFDLNNVHGSNWNKYRIKAAVILYDKKMVAQNGVELGGGKHAFSHFYYSFEKIGGKYWFIYVEPAPGNNIGSIMAVDIDPVTLKVSIPKTLASTSSMELTLPVFDGLAMKNIRFAYSPDRKQIMLLVGTGKEIFYLSVLDPELNVIWSSKVNIPGISDRHIRSAVIDNKGQIHISYNPAKSATGYVATFKKTPTPIITTFTIPGATPKEVLVLPSAYDDSLYVAGTYFEHTDNVAGAFRARMATGNPVITPLQKFAFPVSLVEQFDREYWGSTKARKYGVEPLFIAKLLESGKGIVNIVAEMRSVSQGHSVVYETVGSLLAARLGPEEAAFARVPKLKVRMLTIMNDTYFAWAVNNKLVILYNDREQSFSRPIEQSQQEDNNFKNMILAAAIIDKDGQVKREIVTGQQQQNFLGFFEGARVLTPSELQLPVQQVKALGYSANMMALATLTVTP